MAEGSQPIRFKTIGCSSTKNVLGIMLYRDSPTCASAPSTAARSDRPGRGNRGPTFVASFAILLFGIAQDVAHQRDAYFGISHIFTHPPRAFDIPQWQ